MNKNKGFTLVELLAVIAILTILILIALPNIMKLFNEAKKKTLIIDTQSMAKSVENLYMSEAFNGNLVDEVSDDGNYSLNRSTGKDYKYKFILDKSGNVVSIIVSDGVNCIETNKNYAEITTDDVYDCNMELNGNNFYVKILKDNTAKSDASIDLSKSSFISSTYITVKNDSEEEYIYDSAKQYCYSNDYSFDGTNHILDSYDCGAFSVDYNYFCEDDYYCKTMYELIDGSEIDDAHVYRHTATPTDITENGKGLFYTTRESERYYYFRGNVTNNNLVFANSLWKIIRINPDNSLRIMLYDKIGSNAFNNTNTDARYIGYMYGNNSNSYESTHSNINSSNLKTTLDYVASQMVGSVGDYLTDYGFCYDRSTYRQTGYTAFNTDIDDTALTDRAKSIVAFLKNKNANFTDSGLGYGQNDTFYSIFYRALYGTPTYSCKNKNDLFTTSANSKGNQALTYPIGLLTADEAIYAGAEFGNVNTHYYLYYSEPWLLFTPLGSYHDPQQNNEFTNSLVVGNIGLSYGDVDDTYFAIRPVVDLKAEVLYDTGDGTPSNPYHIKLEQ